MFIKLQQKITKKISQLAIANSQLSIIISNSASHIITNAHIEIIIFDKNEKSTSRKRERLSKNNSIAFFAKSTMSYQKIWTIFKKQSIRYNDTRIINCQKILIFAKWTNNRESNHFDKFFDFVKWVANNWSNHINNKKYRYINQSK